MGKEPELINIYLKIHQKRELSWEDLSFLARHDPECFEKTCKNVIYNAPEAKKVIEPVLKELEEKKITGFSDSAKDAPSSDNKKHPFFKKKEASSTAIEEVLNKLKKLDMKQLPMPDIDTSKVKALLGNLYMELLFPHNDKDTFFGTEESKGQGFDSKA